MTSDAEMVKVEVKECNKATGEVKDGEKKSVQGLWTMMKEKALETGVQGVPNIGRARDWVRRVFWTLVVVGGTGAWSRN